MGHGITGKTHIEIGGDRRALVCDMNAASVLFQQHGEQWQLWLAERFLGEEVEIPGADGEPQKARRLKPLSPKETVDTLYALLATDIEDGGHADTPASLRRAFGIADLADVQVALLEAVMAGFGLPGEIIEAVVSAAAGPRIDKAAAGTGTRR